MGWWFQNMEISHEMSILPFGPTSARFLLKLLVQADSGKCRDRCGKCSRHNSWHQQTVRAVMERHRQLSKAMAPISTSTWIYSTYRFLAIFLWEKSNVSVYIYIHLLLPRPEAYLHNDSLSISIDVEMLNEVQNLICVLYDSVFCSVCYISSWIRASLGLAPICHQVSDPTRQKVLHFPGVARQPPVGCFVTAHGQS